jgi:hypothetical protein
MRIFLTWALCAALARAYVGGGGVGGPGWASGIAGAGADAAPVGRAKEAMEGCGGKEGGEIDQEAEWTARIPNSGSSVQVH